jgi:hypothetical protein
MKSCINLLNSKLIDSIIRHDYKSMLILITKAILPSYQDDYGGDDSCQEHKATEHPQSYYGSCMTIIHCILLTTLLLVK